MICLNGYLEKKKFVEEKKIDETYFKNDKLREDFYAATFLTYVYKDDPHEIHGIDEINIRGIQISESELSRNFMNCVFIFLI